MKVYKNGVLYCEITSPNELLGMYQNISNNLRNNYYTNTETMSLIASSRSVYQVDTMPETPAINTIYYVGTEAPYDVKLVDSNGNIVDLGNSDTPMSEYFKTAEFDGETITYNGTTKKASSKAIIDVAGLPESNINENVYYRDQSDENKIKYYNNNQWNDLGSGGSVGARLYRHSIKWGNSSDANSYLIFYFDTTHSTPYTTASEVGVAMNALGLNSRNPVSAYNHVPDVPGLIYTIYVLENGQLYYKNGPTASSYVQTMWNFLDDIVTPLYTISAGETEGYRETRELIMNTPVGGTSSVSGNITLTKSMSNFDYLDIYCQVGNDTKINSDRRIRVSDLIEYYNTSNTPYRIDISDTGDYRRFINLWRTSDTTVGYNGTNMKVMKIYGVSTKPIVVGDKPYKQLFVSATGATGTITLNDDITKFTYLEVLGRRSDYIIATKIPVARIINQGYKPLCNTAWENGNFWVFTAKVSGSNTQFTINNQGSNGIIEVIGWY